MRISAIRVLFLKGILSLQKPYYLVDGSQRAAQVEQIRLVQVDTLHHCPFQHLAYVEVELCGQCVRLFSQQARHLLRFIQALAQGLIVSLEAHRLDSLAPHSAKATLRHLLAHPVEAYLLLVVSWIYQSFFSFSSQFNKSSFPYISTIPSAPSRRYSAPGISNPCADSQRALP